MCRLCWEKPYPNRYTVEEMRMTITATPATTPMTMAIVWCLGSSVAGSSAGEEIRALSVKGDHAVKRIFSLSLAFPLGLYCVLR